MAAWKCFLAFDILIHDIAFQVEWTSITYSITCKMSLGWFIKGGIFGGAYHFDGISTYDIHIHVYSTWLLVYIHMLCLQVYIYTIVVILTPFPEQGSELTLGQGVNCSVTHRRFIHTWIKYTTQYTNIAVTYPTITTLCSIRNKTWHYVRSWICCERPVQLAVIAKNHINICYLHLTRCPLKETVKLCIRIVVPKFPM